MARHAARQAAVYLSTSGSGNAIPVTMAAWSLNGTQDTIDVTSFRDANKRYVVGLPDTQGEFSGFWDDGETTMYSASRSSDGCKLYLYPDIVNNASSYFYGPAWLDFSMNCTVAGAVEVSGSFRANGDWGANNI